jgi:hypothetical protein
MVETRNSYCISVGRSAHISETKCRWENNTKVDLKAIWCEDVQDRTQWRDLVIVVMNLEVPYEAEDFMSFGSQNNFSPHN